LASDAAAAAQPYSRPPAPAAPPGDPWPHPADPTGAGTPQSAPARATWTSPQPTAAATPSPAAPAPPQRGDGPQAARDDARYAPWIRPALLALVVLLALTVGVGAYLLLQQLR
jgi:hypothetical protein